MVQPENVATPFDVVTGKQPVRITPEAVIETAADALVTMLPFTSVTATTGWVGRTTLAVELEGWVMNTSFVAVPGGVTPTLPLGALDAVHVLYTEVTV
jgi:hypothetical protein